MEAGPRFELKLYQLLAQSSRPRSRMNGCSVRISTLPSEKLVTPTTPTLPNPRNGGKARERKGFTSTYEGACVPRMLWWRPVHHTHTHTHTPDTETGE